jgi:hypothetical protein
MANRGAPSPTGFALITQDERDRQRRPSRSWPSVQQSRGEIRTAVSATRTRHASLSECEDTRKVQFNSRAGPQSFQPGASSRDPRGLQTEPLGHAGRAARPRGLATDWLSACHSIRRPHLVTMTKPPGVMLDHATNERRKRDHVDLLPDQVVLGVILLRDIAPLSCGGDDGYTEVRALSLGRAY